MYHHSTAGISQSSVGDKVTDHNDGHDHHNVEGDKITFIGGTKYENVNAEFGKFIRGNYDIMVVGNSQHTSPNFTFNDSQQFIVNAGANIVLSSPAIYANTSSFTINSTSSTVLTVGNSQTNTLITPTSVTSPAFYVGDPVEFINTIALTIGSLVVSANGSNGTPNQVLTSNGAGVFWNNPVTNAAGTNTNVQFNNSNVQYGSNGFNFDYTQNNVTIANTLTVNTLNVVSVYANGIVGGAGQVLASGGGVANDYWLSIGAGLTLGGTNTQITFNDSGALNATAGFIFNKTTNTVVIGNATVNASVNSTIYTGISLLANNASYLGGNSAANLISYATNAYNNAITYVGSLSLVNTAQLSGNLANYQTTVGLAANVTTMTANDTLYVGTVTAANVVSNTQLIANLANYYPNSNPQNFINSTSLSVPATYVQNTDSRTLSGNLTFTSANHNIQGTNLYITSNLTFTGALIVAASANLMVNNFSVGNSTTNASVNSTIYTGTALNANSAAYLGTSLASAYQLNSALVANVATMTANNSGYLGTVIASSYQLNSTLAANVATMTANNSTNFAGQAQGFYANVTSPSFTTSISVGANVSANTLGFFAGNATVNLIVNSTSYIQGNTTVYVTGNSSTDIFVGINTNTAVNSSVLLIGNATVNATINSTVFTGTANNTSFVGTVSAANVVSNAQLVANLANYYLTTNPSGYISAVGAAYVQNTDSRTLSGNLTFSSTNTVFSSNITSTGALITAASANLFVNNFSVGNSTVNASVNSTIYTGTANNSTNLGGTAAASYQLNSTLAANVATMTANNSGYLGTVIASSYQLNSTLAANVATMTANNSTNFAGQAQGFYANVTSPSFTTSISVGANVSANTLGFFAGNATVNLIVNSTSYIQGNTTVYVTGNSSTDIFVGINTNTAVNSSVLLIGNATVNATINSTVFTGTANNATNLGGIAATGYANVTNPSFANITITTNTLNLGVFSLTATGYSYLPNGLLMQWGNITLTMNATTSNTLSFPVAFPHSCFNVSLTANTATGETMALIAVSTTTATVLGYFSGAPSARNFYWSAIGY